jgi:hypothetical protein
MTSLLVDYPSGLNSKRLPECLVPTGLEVDVDVTGLAFEIKSDVELWSYSGLTACTGIHQVKGSMI